MKFFEKDGNGMVGMAKMDGMDEMDEATENALRQFRASVTVWSELEMTAVLQEDTLLTPQRNGWLVWRPIAGWAMACLLMVAAVGIPLDLRHRDLHQRQQVDAAQAAKRQHERQIAADEARVDQIRADQARRKATAARLDDTMTDEELLKDVDTDIAQAAPDAMEPLARMMQSGSTR